jgi:hypothetical protein
MKIATHIGLGLVSLALSMVADAYGQQAGAVNAGPQPTIASPSTAGQSGMAANRAGSGMNQTGAAGASAANGNGSMSNSVNSGTQRLYDNSAAMGNRSGMQDRNMDRSMLDNGRDMNDRSTANNGQPRGEIGVWLVENGGQGVRVGRIAGGGAAERAGVRSGDVIVQVNGEDVSSPTTAAREIRQIPVGQTATLTVLRDGGRQQFPVTLEAARAGQSYRVGYRGDSGDEREMSRSEGGLAGRTARLEQEVESLSSELRQLRQQMRGGAAGNDANGAQSGAGIGPMTNTTEPNGAIPPQYGAGSTTPSATATSNASPGTSTNGSAAGGSSSTSGSALGTNSSSGSNSQDLFGGGAATSNSSTASGRSGTAGGAGGASGSDTVGSSGGAGTSGPGTSGAAGTSGGTGAGGTSGGAGGAGAAGGAGGSSGAGGSGGGGK